MGAGGSVAAPAPSRTAAGMALMTVAVAIVPGMDAIAKLLGPDGAAYGLGPTLAPLQIAFARFAVQAALMAPTAIAALGLAAALAPPRLGLLILRGVLIAAATALFFAALQFIPLADAVAIFFVAPLLLTLLSSLALGETVGWRRGGAVAVGFLGALLIVRPNFAAVGPAALLPLGTALCFAVYLLITKMLTNDGAKSFALQLWAGLSGSVGLAAAMAVAVAMGDAAPAWAVPVAPTGAQWALLGLLGVIATAAHLSLVAAFQRAPASTLAPLQYLEIVAAAALGFALFGDVPDGVALAGMLLIVGSGAVVVWRERVRRGPREAPLGVGRAAGAAAQTPQPTAARSRADDGS